MTFKNVRRSALTFALSVGFILPQMPHKVLAQEKSVLLDLFPADKKDDTGLFPASPLLPGSGGKANNSVMPTPVTGGNNNTVKPNTAQTPRTAKASMNTAKVSEENSCPLFANRPHAALIADIDSITKEVQASPECTGSPSAKSIEENGNTIKESIASLQAIMNTQDPNLVNTAQIDQTMTAALAAIGNLGNIVNNNSFLNSKCGRQSMSTGKVLLGLNDVINGFAPYALFAVSMNAALAPALPFVIGGVIATSGISAIAKMIDQNTLDMTNPDHRKAVLQNTCQYTKIAKKIRFMQLAQSGKIETITRELEKEVSLYNTNFSNPSRELSALLKYKDAKTKATVAIENQYKNDISDLVTMENQIKQNSDDLMVCTLSNELVNWAQDGKTFPASAFLNLQAATSQGDRAQKLQATTMVSLHTTSMKRIADYSAKAFEDDSALKGCAQAGRSWLAGVRQSVQMTYDITNKIRSELETELSRSVEYTQWKAQYTRIQTQKVTISRVEKAMKELAKDDSVIDRSELAQRMVILKAGLFGSRSAWGFGSPPVLAWINHTKRMHDQAISGLSTNMKSLRDGAYSLTESGRGNAVKVSITGQVYIDPNVEAKSYEERQTLGSFNLNQLQVGSREHEIACQQLESAWLDWSAAIDHLGAIQLFCDMIDPVLDVKMDSSLVKACRGDVALNGTTYAKSTVEAARDVLVRKGFQSDATLVSAKLKELSCPMPAVTDMNQ